MKMITLIYIMNNTLLLLHEIESAYEKEWEILKLPGEITGFILMHVPIILFFFYGLLEIERGTKAGLVIGLICGLGGIIPVVVHKLFVRRSDRFNRLVSDVLIYTNCVIGAALAVLAGTSLV